MQNVDPTPKLFSTPLDHRRHHHHHHRRGPIESKGQNEPRNLSPNAPGGALRNFETNTMYNNNNNNNRNSLSQNESSISLTSPRPGANRSQNLYVETPCTSSDLFVLSSLSPVISSPSSIYSSSSSSWPSSKKPPEAPENSIICNSCGCCRCEACRSPRKLPQKWLCSDKWLCSPTTIVETLSCYCCLAGAFYHCRKDEFQDSTDKPCSCSSPDNLVLRWSCLTGLSFLLPCLCLYLPLSACLKLSERLYGKYSISGCRCHEEKPSGNNPSHHHNNIHNNNNNSNNNNNNNNNNSDHLSGGNPVFSTDSSQKRLLE